MAVYNASKAAQHSLNETLRIELEPFGVRVINVVTGAIDTLVMTKNVAAGIEFQLPSKSIYQVIFDKIRARADGTEKVPRTSPADYAKVSATLRRCGQANNPAERDCSLWWLVFKPEQQVQNG